MQVFEATLVARGQSPSLAFVHSKTCGFHGSFAPGTSIREVQQAVFPQPARARREGEIQFRIDLAFVLREDLQLCEEALTAPSPDCGDPRSARGRRNFSPPSPARSRRALRHYGHTAGPRPPPDDSRSCRRAPRSSRAHHASRESRAAGPAPLSRSRRR